jgi:hypothetical protein
VKVSRQPNFRGGETGAFTQTELLIVVVAVLLVIALAIPWLAKNGATARLNRCRDNLKQVGLAHKVWGLAEEFPMHASTNKGGTKEIIGTGLTFRHYLAMSNELISPKVLLCPSDWKRSTAKNWGTLGNANISYFVGVDAVEEHPYALLAGDRHLSFKLPGTSGLQTLSTTNMPWWTEELHRKVGNVALADGGVQKCDDAMLRHHVRSDLIGAGP